VSKKSLHEMRELQIIALIRFRDEYTNIGTQDSWQTHSHLQTGNVSQTYYQKSINCDELNSRYTTHRRNPQNELKPGASAPGAGAPTLLLGEVAPGAGASRDSFPEIQSAIVASAAPALNNRPLYQSWG